MSTPALDDLTPGLRATANGSLPSATGGEPTSVKGYLERYPGLSDVLSEMSDEAKREFGPAAELRVAVYRDPEIDDAYLTMSVRLPDYPAGFLDHIERLNHRFEDRIDPSSGYLLLTTDFGKPGLGHDV